MSRENVQIVSGLYDAFARGDLDAFEQGLSKDLVWNEAENGLTCSGNPYRSFAAVRDGVFAPTMRDFDQFRCDVEQLYDAGDTVVGTGRYRGISRATGQEMSVQFCHLFHLDGDGKIDRAQEYSDTLQAAEVVGRVQQIEVVEIPHPVM